MSAPIRPHVKKGGQPTKLNKEIMDKIVSVLKVGAYIETAAAYVGISKDSIYEWMKKGAVAKGGIYKEFSDAMGKAISEAEMMMLTTVVQAARGNTTGRYLKDSDGNYILDRHGAKIAIKNVQPDAQSAQWILERRHNKRWGNKQQVEVVNPDDELTEEQALAELENMNKRLEAIKRGKPEGS